MWRDPKQLSITDDFVFGRGRGGRVLFREPMRLPSSPQYAEIERRIVRHEIALSVFTALFWWMT